MMKGKRNIWLKNVMLGGNLASNFIGIASVTFLLSRPKSGLSQGAWNLLQKAGWVFDPFVFALLAVLIWLYERPMRQFIDHGFQSTPLSTELRLKARQRMLNEPYFLMAMNFCLWLSAAVFYSVALLINGVEVYQIGGGFLRSLFTGLVTSIVAFFVLQFIKQKWLAPYFFPFGGLHRTPRTLRIRIGTRLGALLFACNIVPFVAILHVLHYMPLAGGDPAQILERLTSALNTDIFVFMGMGIWVTVLVTRNLTLPLQSITRVLRQIHQGKFDSKVLVTTNDEIGYTGDVINEMTDGLKERDFIKETFGRYVTEEVRDEILSGKVPLDGEIKEVTVLFADLRKFTRLAESRPPNEVVRILNGYFKEMEEAIHQNYGLVLQYIGDEIEAVFGAPIYRKDHPKTAVQAALEMRERLCRVNTDLKSQGYDPLAHGIGVHTGKVVAANIGSPHRLSYALVGDTVNLASRLQELTKAFDTEIIISGSTRVCLDDGFSLRRLSSTTVRGKNQPVEIFSLV